MATRSRPRARAWSRSGQPSASGRSSGDAPSSPNGPTGSTCGFSLALVAVALVGFRTGFFGWEWTVAAGGGVVLGLVTAHVTSAFRLPAVVTLMGLAAAYFLLGGPLAVRGDLVAGFLPSGQTFHDLAHTLVHGWKRLVTMLPPVDAVGPLLALPFIVGLVGAAVTYAVARRWSSPYAVVLAPLALLALAIVLGTLEPAVRAGAGRPVRRCSPSAGWCCARRATGRPCRTAPAAAPGPGSRLGRWRRRCGRLCRRAAPARRRRRRPGGGPIRRDAALRRRAVPEPARRFPPLHRAQRRRPLGPDLLRVQGLPAGTPLRFATLDAYDGAVWGASDRANNGTQVPGTAFQQVGPRVAARGQGQPVRVRVTVPEGGYRDVWLPTAGTVTGVAFDGGRADQLASRLWLNVDTSTGDRARPAAPGDATR